jgi:hypothetical protein
MKLKKITAATRESELTDALIDSYVKWREQSGAVAESYRSWDRAPRDERAVAYATYVLALDREEHAARAYRSLVEAMQAI